MDAPSAPGDVLAQPTRAKLFTLLTDLRRPASTEELAEALDLHPNGVRLHLDRLQKAGLVTRERERIARGRPRDRWAVSPDAQPGGDPPTAYADLGRWLVRSLVTTKTSVREVEEAGRAIGRDLAPRDTGGTPEEAMHATLTALGFAPRREREDDERLVYRLGNCPYRDVVGERQQLVCGLHRGITRGLLDTLDPKTTLSSFEPQDPCSAGCLVRLRGGLAAADQPRER